MDDTQTPVAKVCAPDPSVGRARSASGGRFRSKRHQRGAVAVLATGCLLLVLVVCGLALDIGQLYNRKMELQAVADAAAIAAASQLNGTMQGITNAKNRARAVVEDGNRTLRVRYNADKVEWSDAAVDFSPSIGENAAWSSSASAASVGGLRFARVDMSRLTEDYGLVDTLFIHVLAPRLAQIRLNAISVAGRSSINVTPMAVCAMSGNKAEARNNPANGSTPANVELVEYGFRRGVSYDLMQLNPGGTAPEHFILDPETPPGGTGSAANVAVNVAAPYICTGTMAVKSLQGGDVSVFRPFPLNELFSAFNSRFGDYTGGVCSANGAPPDFNVKPYEYPSIGWMSTARAGQAAQSYTDGGILHTVADPVPPPAAATAAAYGPLWAYARAVPFSAYTEGVPEPANGYTPFGSSAWPALYGPGKPVATGYPSGTGTPYATSTGSHFQSAPSDYRPGVRHRRVLNVPLLECPVTGSRARVAGIGRFFMTVPATSTALVAEFAGLVQETTLGGKVELYR